MGCQYYLAGTTAPPLVEIGLTDLPKSGGAMTAPAPLGTTGLCSIRHPSFVQRTLNLY